MPMFASARSVGLALSWAFITAYMMAALRTTVWAQADIVDPIYMVRAVPGTKRGDNDTLIFGRLNQTADDMLVFLPVKGVSPLSYDGDDTQNYGAGAVLEPGRQQPTLYWFGGNYCELGSSFLFQARDGQVRSVQGRALGYCLHFFVPLPAAETTKQQGNHYDSANSADCQHANGNRPKNSAASQVYTIGVAVFARTVHLMALDPDSLNVTLVFDLPGLEQEWPQGLVAGPPASSFASSAPSDKDSNTNNAQKNINNSPTLLLFTVSNGGSSFKLYLLDIANKSCTLLDFIKWPSGQKVDFSDSSVAGIVPARPHTLFLTGSDETKLVAAMYSVDLKTGLVKHEFPVGDFLDHISCTVGTQLKPSNVYCFDRDGQADIYALLINDMSSGQAQFLEAHDKLFYTEAIMVATR